MDCPDRAGSIPAGCYDRGVSMTCIHCDAEVDETGVEIENQDIMIDSNGNDVWYTFYMYYCPVCDMYVRAN